MQGFDWHSGEIDLSTPIDRDYKNTQNVRRFFIENCGPGFKFDRDFMAYLKSGDAKTMAHAVDEWQRRQA